MARVPPTAAATWMLQNFAPQFNVHAESCPQPQRNEGPPFISVCLKQRERLLTQKVWCQVIILYGINSQLTIHEHY